MSDRVCTITGFGGRPYRMVDPGGRVGSKVSHGEPYERRLLVDVRQQHHRGTAVDAGAHVGNHSLFMAAVCGLRVLAFECHHATAGRLRANVALNPDLDIEVHEFALGAREGTGTLTPGRWVEFDPTRADKGCVAAEPGPIPVHPFDDLFDLDDLTVVKVDVEGTEADVLAGMAGHLERCRPHVYAETHTDAAEERIAAVLHPLGYAITRRIHMGSTMHRWQHRGRP